MKKKVKIIIGLLVVLLLCSGVLGYLYFNYINKTETRYLANELNEVHVFDKELNDVSFFRGIRVDLKVNKKKEIDNQEFKEIIIDEETYYVKEKYLCEEERDAVKEKTLFVNRPAVIYKESEGPEISFFVDKNTEVEVIDYDYLNKDGSVNKYLVSYNGNSGYICGDENHVGLSFIDKRADGSIYSSESFSAGKASDVDYYYKDLAEGSDLVYIQGNRMPDVVNSLYINADGICDVDEYIEYASTTSVNAFVVDIKDTHVISYDSSVIHKYSPSSNDGINTYDEFKEAIRKLNDAGYYTIGRITVFKDPKFALDHTECCIENEGSLYYYNSSYWPSIFSRYVWEYNVSLAYEAVKEFGFNEIQFDYVRTPEIVPYSADMKNVYGENRLQAITNFIRYASEVLHEAGAYVSIDVFGETSGGYATAYGQFWPAISNAADVISAMPYPDHYGPGYYGLEYPWKEPYYTLYYWGKDAASCQKHTYTPARVRTWIQAYDSIADGTVYDAGMIKQQLDGLKDAGVFDGFITWNAAGSLGKYQSYYSVLK